MGECVDSSQGELMRMIEFSTEDVGTDKVEMALQLLFLLAVRVPLLEHVLARLRA